MGGSPKVGSTVSLVLCGLTGCTSFNVGGHDNLAVRNGPQEAVPHSQVTPGDPLLGTAVAIEMPAT